MPGYVVGRSYGQSVFPFSCLIPTAQLYPCGLNNRDTSGQDPEKKVENVLSDAVEVLKAPLRMQRVLKQYNRSVSSFGFVVSRLI